MYLTSNAARALGKKLFPLFSLALDMDEHFFDDKVLCFPLATRASGNIRNVPQTKEAAAVMRILHYPPQTGPHDDRLMGIGAHTEYLLNYISMNFS